MAIRKYLVYLLIGILALFAIGYATNVADFAGKTNGGLVSPISENKTPEDNVDIIKNPKTLEIPKLKINAPIEYVGLTKDKKMDVPKAYENVAWYKDGYYVGERGNAVISGHVDTPQGARAIFADLDQVKVDDNIIVWDDKKSVIYQVYDIQTYPVDQFPLEKVFGKTTDFNLNIITCDGNLINGQYPNRLVIYARKI